MPKIAKEPTITTSVINSRPRVRLAYLCVADHYSCQCYEHRRDWLEQKLQFFASVFAIRLSTYASISNHYHLVLHIRADIADQWRDLDVVKQWHKLFNRKCGQVIGFG